MSAELTSHCLPAARPSADCPDAQQQCRVSIHDDASTFELKYSRSCDFQPCLVLTHASGAEPV